MLEIRDLHVNYGAISALHGISLKVEQGRIVTLIGANGAGKSTTLRAISGLVKPRSGVINFENHDTIGMIALDASGNLSGSCTTSGLAYKLHGRVGDSPIIGAGLFVDNEVGAATATGTGEEVIRIAGSHTVVEMMRAGHTPEEACRIAVERVSKSPKNVKEMQIGFLAINKHGEFGGYALQKGFNFAVCSGEIKNEMRDAKSLW